MGDFRRRRPGVALRCCVALVLAAALGISLNGARADAATPLASASVIVNRPPVDSLASLCITSHTLDPGGTCVGSASGHVSDAFVCQATGSVGPIFGDATRGGALYNGQAQGAGTCESAQGSWTVSYVGQWEASVSFSTPSGPAPALYELVLTLTNTATGQVDELRQAWQQPNVDDPPIIVETDDAAPQPLGAGTILESPPVRAFTTPFNTTTDWTFTPPG